MTPNFEWYFGNQRINTIDESLTLYSSDEFQSLTRSTVPFLSLIKHGGNLWNSIVDRLVTSNEPLKAHLEFCVSPPMGRGTASHTDLLLLNSKEAVAIEAKWTEPRYQQVDRWMTSSNRREVMAGWLSLLQTQIPAPLVAEDFGSIVYQAVHRAASACSFIDRTPALAYIQFTLKPDGRQKQLSNDLTALHKKLGSPERFPFRVFNVLMEPTQSFTAIEHLPKGSAGTGESVREAFLKVPLFRFISFEVITAPASLSLDSTDNRTASLESVLQCGSDAEKEM